MAGWMALSPLLMVILMLMLMLMVGNVGDALLRCCARFNTKYGHDAAPNSITFR